MKLKLLKISIKVSKMKPWIMFLDILYPSLLEFSSVPENQSLPELNHRTEV